MSAIALPAPNRRKAVPQWVGLIMLMGLVFMSRGVRLSIDVSDAGSDPDAAGCRPGQTTIAVSNPPTPSAVNTAISAASNGDCVQFPASVSVNWSATMVSTSKGITIDGNGSTITRTGGPSVPLFTVTLNSSAMFRITNLNFVQTAPQVDSTDRNLVLLLSGISTDKKFRFDHNTLTGSAAPTVFLDLDGWGVIDSNDWSAPDNSEMIQIKGIGTWTDTITPGGQDFVVVEANTFTNNGTGNANSSIQAYFSARYVARYNTFNQSQVDMHGTSGEEGTRYAEIYENDFNNPAGAKHSDKTCDCRAGSGLIYNNHHTGGVSEPIYFREEDTGAWPRAWQPGSGYGGHTDGHSTCAVARGTLSNPSNTAPFYTWGNDMDVQTHSEDTGVTVEGRDWIDFASQPTDIYQMNASTDTCSTHYSYTPLAYPHPVRSL